MPSRYGWLITRDHLAEIDGDDWNDTGKLGPWNISDDFVNRLTIAGEGYTFRMYDDDGELYYTGKAIAIDSTIGDEEFAYGPLGDFGMPNAGCTMIRWHGHKEWNCS